ncbi:MAG: glycosyltransferase family 2 protein [candidate division WS1 bacterium]|nr:glycosyltransferase family 2 protein [candidate division WS1 bacterium]
MKLIVQIPCLNEEETIPQTIADIPREIEGIDAVEVLVIDDGSSDATVEAARAAGADHVISFAQNRGLAAAWSAGIDAALRLGADVIVNTDADNQYAGSSIPDLVRPIVAGDADMVVGARPIDQIEEFSWMKKRLQRLGSWVVRKVSSTHISDATSGFRAYSRDAAIRLAVVSNFTYTHETLIQAGRTGLAVAEVPIGTNPKTRESRLFRSIPEYIRRSVGTILRIYALYEPLALFNLVAGILLAIGILLGIRYAYFMAIGEGTGHVQSVIVAALLLMLAAQAFALGLLADLIAANRKLIQDARSRLREVQFRDGNDH